MGIINFTGVVPGSKEDIDQVLRQKGFESNDLLAKYICSDGVSYSIFTLGEQRVLGLPGTKREGEAIINEPEYVLENYDELRDNDCFSDSCWVSLDCDDKEALKNLKLSDTEVLGSIEDAIVYLHELEQDLEKGGSHHSYWAGEAYINKKFQDDEDLDLSLGM